MWKRSGAATMEDMAKTDVVTVRGLRKTYGNLVVVDRLDLDVPAGEIVGLAGRCRPCSRCTCCPASPWVPSTRRSPTRRSPECPPRWPGWPPRSAGGPAPPLVPRSPETIVGSASAHGGAAFTSTAHGVWWLVLALGAGIVALGLLSTGRGATGTTGRAAALLDGGEEGRPELSGALARGSIWTVPIVRTQNAVNRGAT